MLVLPVIDLQAGIAVHGRAGHRSAYRPVQSILAPSSRAQDLAIGCLQRLGLTQLYLADLDAIEGGPPQWDVYQEVSQLGVDLWLDAGVTDRQQLMQLSDRLGDRSDVVLGLESITSPRVLRQAIDRWSPQRVVASLDLDDGVPRTAISEWSELSPMSVAELLVDCGIRRLILLDIRRVGMGQGTGTVDLLTRLRNAYPEIQLICGGGIRHLSDVEQLDELGCDAVLLATALHDGRIGRKEIDRLRGDIR